MSGSFTSVSLSIVKAVCTVSTEDLTGAVSFGILGVSGCGLEGALELALDEALFCYADEKFSFTADARRDDLGYVPEPDMALYALRVGKFQYYWKEQIWVLILVKADGAEDTFRRIGIAELTDDEWDERSATPRAITII